MDKERLKEYHAEYYEENKKKWESRRTPENRDKWNAARRAKYASDPEYKAKMKADAKEWQKSHPRKRKAQRIKKFGITLEEFDKMLKLQDGKCAICGYSDMSDPNFFPVIDHDHATKTVRGLLCMQCNMGIGKFMDDPRVLRSAAKYLEGYNG